MRAWGHDLYVVLIIQALQSLRYTYCLFFKKVHKISHSVSYIPYSGKFSHGAGNNYKIIICLPKANWWVGRELETEAPGDDVIYLRDSQP